VAGKTIRIYLVSGDPAGIQIAEVLNWTGKILVAPKATLPDLLQREETNRTGVYCLVGPNPADPSRNLVYVGEGDSVAGRLRAHAKDSSKDFWTQTIVMVSSDANLTKAHVRYLEARIVEETQAAQRALLSNATNPEGGMLPEPEKDAMDEFLGNVRLVLSAVGFDFLTRPLPVNTDANSDGAPTESPIFVLRQGEYLAHAQGSGRDFVVLKGSTARRVGMPSWQSFRSMRQSLEEDGTLVPNPDGSDTLLFSKDTPFASVSAAGAAVLARNVAGPATWVLETTGQTYKDWMESRLPEIGIDE
jgi:hypothetical protein